MHILAQSKWILNDVGVKIVSTLTSVKKVMI